MTTRSQRIALTFGGWAVLVMAVLLLLNFLSLELYFILCLIGFLVLVGVSGPFFSRPPWRSRVNLVIAAGIVQPVWYLWVGWRFWQSKDH